MSKTIESNATGVHAQEMCEQFIDFISDRYPKLRFKCKINSKGTYFAFRTQFRQRRVHAGGFNLEKTMNTFFYHLVRKMTLEKYYPTIQESKELRPLEPFFIKFDCNVFSKIVN
jgi:hypothetical protein